MVEEENGSTSSTIKQRPWVYQYPDWKEKYKDVLERKYNIKRRGLPVTREEIKENIKAKNNKIKRYQSRIYQYQQNCTFKNNQGKFYSELNCEGRNYETTEVPDKGRKKRTLGRYRIAWKFQEGLWIQRGTRRSKNYTRND